VQKNKTKASNWNLIKFKLEIKTMDETESQNHHIQQLRKLELINSLGNKNENSKFDDEPLVVTNRSLGSTQSSESSLNEHLQSLDDFQPTRPQG
jgi:hypothetical protein